MSCFTKTNNYSVENFQKVILPFFENDLFIKWVNDPDIECMAYWEKWMKEHPDQVDTLLQAKDLALDLREVEKPINPEALSEDIWAKIHSRIDPPQTVISLFQSKPKRASYRIAACIAGLLMLTSAAYFLANTHTRKTPAQKVTGILENNTLKRINRTAQNQVVYLVDGTKVILQPESSIKYTVFLQKDKREVFLEGNAFFEVARDPNRPFYVYANDIVLKVLGTSFNVITDKNSGNITVVVKTGKVSVSKNSSRNKTEVILSPNEGILYSVQSRRIVKSGPDSKPLPTNDKPEAQAINFNFDEMPVAGIFATLEEVYGIKINYDEKAFSKCIVTTSLTDESYEEKLKILCAAVNAGYKIGNNEVYIEGTGCK
ncbi:MAG: FecR domain-containing protein [Puia sp.]